MNTNSYSRALKSAFSFSYWAGITIMSIMLLAGFAMGTGYLLLETENDKGLVVFTFLLIYFSLILPLLWVTIKSGYRIYIGENRVSLNTVSTYNEFARSDIVGYAVHERYQSRHRIEILLLRIKSGQEFKLFAHNYTNYPLLKAELTAGVPEDITMKRSYLRHYNKQLLIIYAILLTLIIAGLWYVTNLRDKKPIAAGDLMQISAQLTEPPISEFTTKDGKQSLSIIYFELEGYPQVSFVLKSFALKATLVDESLQMGKVGDLITIAAKKSDMAQLNRLGTIKIYELSHNHRPYLTLERYTLQYRTDMTFYLLLLLASGLAILVLAGMAWWRYKQNE